MSLVSICFVGKDNEPLYMRDFDNHMVDETSSLDTKEPEAGHVHDPFGFFHNEAEASTSTSTNSSSNSCSLHYQFLMHASLDRFEELTGPTSNISSTGGTSSNNTSGSSNNGINRWRTPGSTGNDAMWVGLLCPVDDYRVYGYLTTTNIKLIGVVSCTKSESSGEKNRDRLFGEDLLNSNSHSSSTTGSSNPGSNIDQSSKREAELKNIFVS